MLHSYSPFDKCARLAASRLAWMRPVVGLAACLGLWALAGCGPRDPEQAVHEQVDEAMGFAQSLDFNKAYPIFASLYEELPVSDAHWLEVAYGYATSIWHSTPPGPGQVATAIEVFTRMAGQSPDSDYGLAARLSLARIHMLRDFPGDTQDPGEARRQLEPVLLQDHNAVLRHEAALRFAEALLMEFEVPGRVAEAEAFLSGWVRAHPDNPYASMMWDRLARIYQFDFKDREKALQALLKAEEKGLVSTADIGRVFWNIATLARDLGNHEVAVEYFTRSVTEAPSSGRMWEAQRALREIRATVPGYEDLEIPESVISNMGDDAGVLPGE